MKLTRSQILEIKDMYDGTLTSVRHMAILFDVSVTTVRYHAGHTNLKERDPYKQMKPHTREIWREANEQALKFYKELQSL